MAVSGRGQGHREGARRASCPRPGGMKDSAAHRPFVMNGLTHRRRAVNGIELHCAEAGAGPPVLLLHGFPDFWYGWRYQMPALVRAGYRVIAPDLRGYGESARPRGVRHYAPRELTADIAALISSVGGTAAAVVGHDWGGVIAWRLAARHPAMVRRLVILNAPHPAAYVRELRTNPRQMLRSWYVLFNQLPWVPELIAGAFRRAALRRVLATTEWGATMTDEDDLRWYDAAFAPPGALTAALNYYRAAGRQLLVGRFRGDTRVHVPTLVLWGERDRFLDAGLLDGLERWGSDLRIDRLPHAGHFLHWQDPGTVNALLLAYLAGSPG